MKTFAITQTVGLTMNGRYLPKRYVKYYDMNYHCTVFCTTVLRAIELPLLTHQSTKCVRVNRQRMRDVMAILTKNVSIQTCSKIPEIKPELTLQGVKITPM